MKIDVRAGTLAALLFSLGAIGLPAFAESLAVFPPEMIVDRDAGENLPDPAAMTTDIVRALTERDSLRTFTVAAAYGVDPAEPISRMVVKGYAREHLTDSCLVVTCLVGSATVELDIAIYERSTDSMVRTLYAKGPRGDLAAVEAEMADKVIAALYSWLGIQPIQPRRPARIGFSTGGGWWYPGAWSDAMVSVFYADAGMWFQAGRPESLFGRAAGDAEFGFDVRYQLSDSTPSIEPYLCHMIRLSLPVTYRIDYGKGLGLSLGCSPFYDYGIAIVDRRYGSKETINSGSFGLNAVIGGDCYLGSRERLRIGMRLGLDALLFSSTTVFQPSIGVDLGYAFKEMR